jgi:multimeric flavodoxin WrbA
VGSPNYFRNVSAIMKNFLDRWNAYCSPSRLKGKRTAIVCVGAQAVENTREAARALENFIGDMKMQLAGIVLARADAPKRVLGDKRAMQECFELGQKLAETEP